ncbi:MAG: DHA2 family efflux MFS transporter permease subunit [Kofleriaceae bacterium]
MNSEIITEGSSKRARLLGLVAVLIGQFMLILDATVVNVALPAMRADFALDSTQLSWITNAYLIAFGGLLLLFGRLGDLFGRRRIFRFGLVVFTLASIGCGLAPSADVLIVARFIQGIGAGAASAVVLAIIATEFPAPEDRGKAMSGYMFVSVAGGSLGLFVGGLLTQALGWHWIFLINVPIGLVAYTLASGPDRQAPVLDRRIDWAGAVLVTGAAMAAIYGLVSIAHEPWTSPSVCVSFSVAIALAVVFCYVEVTVANPLMPLRVLRIRSLAITSVIRGFMAMGLYGVFFLASLDMSQTLGFGPLRVGLAFLPQTLVVAVLSLGVTARLVRRFGPQRVLVAGLAIAVVGLAIMAQLAIDAPYFPARGFAHVLLGLGFGMSFLPLLTLAMSEVPAKDAGLGSAIVNLSLQLAAAVNLAILVAVAAFREHGLEAAGMAAREATVHGYRTAYAVAIAGVLVGLTLAATLLRDPRPRRL